MIDESTMEQLIPIPDEDEKMEEIAAELAAEGFLINNFNKGGIFYILTRICIKIGIEIKNLARTVVNSGFIRHAEGDWLIIKSADYSKTLKDAVKAQGYITIFRSDNTHALQITKGHMFKTLPDVNGNELKYYALSSTVIPAGDVMGRVLVEAELPGVAYNVLPGKITVSMIHLEGVERVENGDEWLYIEGVEEETLESLRERTLSSYAELAERTIEEKLQNRVRGVPGVITARIDAQHPRGQGTVDIIITGSAGQATPELILKVEEAIETLKGNYEDYLVKSSEVVIQDFEIVVYLASGMSTEGVDAQARRIIEDMMNLSRNEDLNLLYRDSIISRFSNQISGYKKSDIIEPASDVHLDKNKVIMMGNVNVVVRNVETR